MGKHKDLRYFNKSRIVVALVKGDSISKIAQKKNCDKINNIKGSLMNMGSKSLPV